MLWPKYSLREHNKAAKMILASKKEEVFVAVDDDGSHVGFMETSIRKEYVHGAKFGKPVGYIEGLFVKKPYRRTGVAKGLVKIAEKWAKERGCMQMGSDAYQRNSASRAFHKKIGYKEAGIITHFIKKI